MPVTLCTYNINNLFLRYKFGKTFPGDRSGQSKTSDARWGYLPMYKPGLFDVFKPEQRRLTAQSLVLEDHHTPDILCLQEVESLQALRAFNQRHFKEPYPYALSVDSRDLRQIDVAILSRFRLAGFRSHVDLADSEDEGYPWLFSRDCLEVDVELPEPGKKRLTVFINHFKSKLSTKKTEKARKADMARAAEKRRRQAEEVVKIVRERFPGDAFETGLFAVVGDLNDEPGSPSLAPLVQNAGLENAVNRLNPEKRWTHYWKDENQVSQFDYLLLSPELSRITAGQAPFVQRRGLGFRDVSRRDGLPLPATVRLARGVEEAASPEVDFRFERLKDAGPKLCASDHCPVAMTIPV